MASDEIEKTINKLENDLLQINENKEYPVIDTVSDVITLFAKAFKNISNVIPGSIADPIAKLFYETVLIANSAIENRKRCNELKIFVKCALENLERSLECGAKPGIDFGKINMEQYMQALAEIVEYMRELANSTISKKVWRFLTSDQVAKKIQKLTTELDRRTYNLTLSLVITIANKNNFPPLSDQKIWEITGLLNGAQASQGLMKQFKKSPKEIEDYHKQVIRGSRNHVIKKILKATQETVAIKEIGKFDTRDEETERQFWSEVAINDYLKDCKYILKFRGVIELGGIRHMIYEWSNHGDLQTYLRVHPNLPWSFKIKVAWEISSALSHCHEMEILHHDVRAHNVMLGVNCIVQLTNFETARPQSGGKSWPLKDKDEILRWTAPEKDSSETRYTSECDVFSFGVLLWEIVSQTRPFDKIKDGTEVFEKILIGERPNINMYMKDGHQISVASDNYFKIMTEAWSQEANHRPSMSSICERLRNIFHTNINEDEIEYTENLSKENDITVLDPLTQTTTSENILTSNENNVKSKEEFLLEKARQYHDAKDYFNAWSIYDNLLKSDKGNAEVKFMVGSYLVHGPPYCQNNDIDKAENYLREAADDGYAKAQYLYYQLLFNKAGKYLKLAANQNYTEALYDHGYHLYKGTFERRDPAKGAESLIAAHYQLHNNALGKLNELEKRHAKEKKMKKE